jgi:hypothetical protein
VSSLKYLPIPLFLLLYDLFLNVGQVVFSVLERSAAILGHERRQHAYVEIAGQTLCWLLLVVVVLLLIRFAIFAHMAPP